MKIGLQNTTGALTYKKANVRSLSDNQLEVQHELLVKTSGSYTDALGNVTVYGQEHIGAPIVRFTPDTAAIAATIQALQDDTQMVTLQLDNLRFTETRVSAEMLVGAPAPVIATA